MKNLVFLVMLVLNIEIEKINDFMTSSDIEDFSFDLRKLYMSMYVGNGEIRIGKQIHSWGSVDEKIAP